MRHETDLWTIEREIRELAEVIACRVIGGPNGRPQHIELLLRPGAAEEAVLAQVRELVQNSLGVEVAPQDITAASLPETAPAAPPPGETERPRLIRLAVSTDGASFEVELDLAWQGREGSARKRGPKGRSGRNRLVAETTLLALENLLGKHDVLALDQLAVNRLESETVVVALISALGEGWEQLLTGAARAASDSALDEAVVRATLSAVNRFLPRLA